MVHTYNNLGKYALLQRSTLAHLPDLRSTKNDNQELIARFAHSSTMPRENGVVQDVHKPATETEKLISLTENSQDNLFVASTVFPFVLFADSLKIDRQKITIVHNSFFKSAQTVSTEVKNIINVQTELGPMFGAITITSKHFLNNTQTIKYLKRKDISTAQCLLQGFMIAHRAKIDTSSIEKEQLLSLLYDLGQENRN